VVLRVLRGVSCCDSLHSDALHKGLRLKPFGERSVKALVVATSGITRATDCGRL